MFTSKYKVQKNSILLLPLWLICSTASAQDRITLSVGLQEFWDSNFARSADVDSEHYTQASLSLAANQRFSKQTLSLNLRGNRYEYDQREDLDVDFYEGQANWRSDWSTRVKTMLSWKRDSYPVDQLEFSGKDVASADTAKAYLSIGTGNRMSFGLGISQLLQSHSNSLRQNLEFDEDEVFVEATYQTSNESSLSARLRDGERIYPFPDPNEPLSLDFNYQQRELEGAWAPSTKTRLSATVGQFERKGEVNDGVGTKAMLDASWAFSEKLKLLLGYSRSEPAVGETSDSPSDVRAGELKMVWEPSAKWVVGMSARYAKQAYLQRGEEPERDETITAFSPLSLTYFFSESLTMRIESQWVDRQSSLVYRDYDYATASAGLSFRF